MLGGMKEETPHKLEPVCALIGLSELIHISINHPFGYHCKILPAHRHAQQREQVWMAEAFPRHYLFAKPLRNRHQHRWANY